ncbi:MAG: tripartite tricarboxylate transporter substrate binding protein, partial [bacterium]
MSQRKPISHLRTATTAATAALGLLSALALTSAAWAQDRYPSKTVRIVVPFPTAGVTDLAARQVAQRLSETWGQPVVVDNRPGAGGTIGSEVGAKAPPDGYTLTIGSVSTHAIAPSLYVKPGYDPLKDFAAITELANTPNVLVINAALPVKTLKELVALAKTRPGELTFGSNGNGTNNHLAGEMLQAVTGIRMQHVPYKGSAFATNDLLGGHISMMFDVVVTALPMVKAGKLRALAIAAPARSPVMPDVPTAAELGLGAFEAVVWLGMWVPAAVPQDIQSRLHAD